MKLLKSKSHKYKTIRGILERFLKSQGYSRLKFSSDWKTYPFTKLLRFISIKGLTPDIVAIKSNEVLAVKFVFNLDYASAMYSVSNAKMYLSGATHIYVAFVKKCWLEQIAELRELVKVFCKENGIGILLIDMESRALEIAREVEGDTTSPKIEAKYNHAVNTEDYVQIQRQIVTTFWLPMCVAVIIGFIPFWASLRGNSIHIHYYWPLLIPTIICFGWIILYFVGIGYRIIGKVTGRIYGAEWRFLSFALMSALMFWIGWSGGFELRKAHVLRNAKKVEPIIHALEKYHQQHKIYPKKLQELPQYAALKKQSGITIQECTEKISIFKLEDADVTFIFNPEGYSVWALVTRPIFPSITRFYYYIRVNKERHWKYVYSIWWWGGLVTHTANDKM